MNCSYAFISIMYRNFNDDNNNYYIIVILIISFLLVLLVCCSDCIIPAAQLTGNTKHRYGSLLASEPDRWRHLHSSSSEFCCSQLIISFHLYYRNLRRPFIIFYLSRSTRGTNYSIFFLFGFLRIRKVKPINNIGERT